MIARVMREASPQKQNKHKYPEAELPKHENNSDFLEGKLRGYQSEIKKLGV